MSSTPQVKVTRSTCCYCGVGCGLLIESDGAQILGVRGDPEHPANFGRLCTKGAALHLAAGDEQRARHPLRRAAGRRGPWERAGWDDTLEELADRFAAIVREHGPDAIAFYVSGQLFTEDYYVFNKLAKGLVGTNNIDTNSRLCMSSAVAGYKATLGADAPPACYEDIDHADLIFIAGSNAAYAHPVVFRRIEDAKARRPELKIVVVDPRRTDTAAAADLHLPILPGTDVALFHGILHWLLWEGRIDRDFIGAHTEGFAALKALLHDYTPKAVAGICAIAEADLLRAAQWFGESSAVLSLYCQGLNQSTQGTAKNAALINLHLATGKIGKPGCGPFSLTGQPNAMGGREVGGLANQLCAHRDLDNPGHRAEVARLWGVPTVPETPGKSAVEMFEAVRRGEIKAIWIACTNPAQSLPDQTRVHEALRRAELVVLQEAYVDTETARHADVLLPAASWAEKDGTVTNSERRITRVRPARAAPGEAREDWAIATAFAQRLERRLRPGLPTLFPYAAAEAVWNEHRETTRGRDLDITGLSYALLETRGPQQWPFPADAVEGRARLYADGRFPTASGKARFFAGPYVAVAEDTDARYPLRLNTGRLRDQWHGMSRTGKVGRLFEHAGEPQLALAPIDMQRRHIADGEVVRVRSRRGELYVRAQSCADQRPGQAFLPLHWGARFMAGLGVNVLTVSRFDAVSKQPELKHAAIEVERADLPWQLVAFALGCVAQDGPGAATALAMRAGLEPLLREFPFATVTLFGREREGVLLRAAGPSPPPAELLARLDGTLGIGENCDGAGVIRYRDAGRGVERKARVVGGVLVAVRLLGDVSAADWLKDWVAAGRSVDNASRLLLAPGARPPAAFVPPGRTVCNCVGVSEADVRSALDGLAPMPPEQALARLKVLLACGTQCGSCVPEVNRLIAARRTASVQAA